MAVASVRVTGNVTEALAALEALGIKAEETGKKTEHALGGAAHRSGNAFQRLGQQLGNWGVPFSSSLTKVGDKFNETDTKGKKFGQSLAEVGKSAVLGLGAGLGVVAVESLKLGMTFQQSSASLQAHAQISAGAAQKIGNAFLTTAGQTTFSAQQMMDAFAPISGQFVTMYGQALNSTQSLTFMRAAMDAAEASGVPLADTTKALASAMMVYHLNVSQASTASDVMWNTSKALGISITDLGSGLSRLEPRIAGSGMSLQQTAAYMLELSKTAGNGRQALRLAGTAIQSMISPSAAAQKALTQMGVTLQDSHGKFIGMRNAIGKLHDAFARMPGDAAAMAAGQQLIGAQTQLATMKTETQTKGLKVQEAALTGHIGMLKLQAGQLSKSSAMMAVFGRNANLMASMVAGGVPAFDAATAAVSKSGTAQSAAETQSATLHGQMEKMKSAVEDLGVKFGDFLIPKLQQLMAVVSDVVGWFEKHKAVAKAVALVIGGVLSAAIGQFIAQMVGGFVSSMSEGLASIGRFIAGLFGFQAAEEETAAVSEETGGGFGPIGIAIGVLVPLLYELFTHWHQIWSGIKHVAADAWHFLDGVWHGIEHTIHAVIQKVIGFIKTHWPEIIAIFLGPIALIVGLIIQHWAQISAFTAQMWHDVVGFVKSLWSDVTGFFGRMWTDVTTAVATGVGSVMTWFESLPGKAMSAVGGLLTDMLSFGENIIHAIVQGIENVAGDIGGALSGIMSSLPGASMLKHIPGIGGLFKAVGGPVAAGRPYVVGEKGPELFVPDGSGTIIPHGQTMAMGNAPTPASAFPTGGSGSPAGGGPAGGGDQHVTVNNYGVPADPNQLATQLAWQLRPYVGA